MTGGARTARLILLTMVINIIQPVRRLLILIIMMVVPRPHESTL